MYEPYTNVTCMSYILTHKIKSTLQSFGAFKIDMTQVKQTSCSKFNTIFNILVPEIPNYVQNKINILKVSIYVLKQVSLKDTSSVLIGKHEHDCKVNKVEQSRIQARWSEK